MKRRKKTRKPDLTGLERFLQFGSLVRVMLMFMGITAISVTFFYTVLKPDAVDDAVIELRHEEAVVQLKSDIMVLRGTWEAVADDPRAVLTVQAEAAELGERMWVRDDSELRLGHRITKYQYAAYAFMMAADVEAHPVKRQRLLARAEEAAQKTLDLISEAFLTESTDEYHRRVADWVRRDAAADRANMLWAQAIAIRVRNGEIGEKQRGRLLLEQLSDQWVERYRPRENPILRYLFEPNHEAAAQQ